MACNKSADRQHIPLSFTGKWYFTEQYMSIGGPGQWNPVEKKRAMDRIKQQWRVQQYSFSFRQGNKL